MNNPHLDQARAWARDNIDDFYEGQRVYAACEVIQSLPDEWIDAEKVQELIDTYKHARDGNAAGTEGWVMNHLVVRNLESLLAPPLPTLAELTPEDREARQWMQARDGQGKLCVIERITSTARLLYEDGYSREELFHKVTPLPDLPRLEWPGDGVVDAPIVDDEPTLPCPEDVPAGEPWLILCNGHEWVGTRDSRDDANYPWALSRLDGIKFTSSKDLDITLVSRLVPEDKP